MRRRMVDIWTRPEEMLCALKHTGNFVDTGRVANGHVSLPLQGEQKGSPAFPAFHLHLSLGDDDDDETLPTPRSIASSWKLVSCYRGYAAFVHKVDQCGKKGMRILATRKFDQIPTVPRYF